MTSPSDRTDLPHTGSEHDSHDGHGAHGGHGLMMLVCCVPMIAIAVVLVATGIAGAGALLWALACLVMMAVMMRAMPGGHR